MMKKAASKANPPPPPAWVEAGKRLAQALKDRKISPSDWGRILFEEEGMKSGYQNARNWRKGRGFNPANQRKAIRILNTRGVGEPLSLDFFGPVQGEGEPSGRVVQHPELDALMKARKLRPDTVEALLALDRAVDVASALYWETQINLHEGHFAMRDANAHIGSPRAPLQPKRRPPRA